MAGELEERRPAARHESFVVRVDVVVVGVALLAALAAALVAAVPHVDFGWRSPALHVGIETTVTVVAVLTAYLLIGRYGLTQSLSDLVLVASLGLLAISNLAFSALPALLGSGQTDFATWAPLLTRGAGALGFAVAAFLPDVRLPSPRRAAAAALFGALVALASVAVGIALLGPVLSPSAGASLSASDTPMTDAPAGFVAIQALTLIAYAVAAVGFTVRARRTRDELTIWIAIAMGLAAASRVHYLLFPAADPDAVFSGDIVRFMSYLALLVGALREIRHYQQRLAVAAVLEERRRMARDLHDGLAQELVFISSQSRRLRDDAVAQRVAHAAERALDESRSAIRALTRRSEDPFDSEVAEVAEQLVARAGARLRLDLQPNVSLPTDLREQLLRILREAVTNGLRHGKATMITVELAGRGGLRMAVRDNGRGFDPSAPGRNGAFGLTSMRERAAALGGTLEVVSEPGRGTLVEVVLP
jgi:signal transduction histidine kinase